MPKFLNSAVPDELNKYKMRPGSELYRRILWFLFFIVGVCILVFGVAIVYALAYQDKVYPGVYAGGASLSGMKQEEVKNFIEQFNDRLAREGLTVAVKGADGNRKMVKITTVSAGDSSVDLMQLDSEELARQALKIGRAGAWWRSVWEPLWLRFFAPVSLSGAVNTEEAILGQLRSVLAPFEKVPRDAALIVINPTSLDYSIIPEQSGYVINYSEVVKQIEDRLSRFNFSPAEIEPLASYPQVKTDDVRGVAGHLGEVLGYGDLLLSYIDSTRGLRRDWVVSTSEYAKWLELRREGEGFVFALNAGKAKDFLQDIKLKIDEPAQDARFVVERERVREFQTSRSGVSMNIDKTYQDLDAVFRERNYGPVDAKNNVAISVDIAEPVIKMGDANALGIIEVLGVGTSTFKDSHTNRIKNIANAVRRLNGVLIKPGEEFSTNRFAGPYTSENGFLPEMVIKGNEIKPEIGGGMCQIGTTLFRMAMNAGMPITQRRNHSLVVNYYADPVNGNPGTDATVYDPSVDFRFLNDTGNYILIQTEIDYKKQMLIFTLWGKSDGRKGWYSHPTVDRWIPAGAPKEIESESLKPGQRRCQNAFRGAVARFIYTRITPSGEKIEREFVSNYRPMPRICVVGVEHPPTPPPESNVSLEESALIEMPNASST